MKTMQARACVRAPTPARRAGAEISLLHDFLEPGGFGAWPGHGVAPRVSLAGGPGACFMPAPLQCPGDILLRKPGLGAMHAADLEIACSA